MTLRELAALAGADLPTNVPDPSLPISGAAALDEAQPGDVTFFANPKYLPALRKTAASVALVPLDFSESLSPVLLKVANPSLTFGEVVRRLAPQPVQYKAGIHPTAIVAADARIADSASIQPFAVIEAGAIIGAGTVVGAHTFVGRESRIGESCLIHPHVTLRERTVLGSRVIIHSGAVVGSDGFGFEFAGGRHVKIDQIGIVQIDDDVEIGAGTTIDRARFGRTWIQTGSKIDNLVQIAHNVVIGPHCLVISQTGISGSARLGSYVTLAGQVGVVGHVTIGDRVTVAAKSGVSKDCPPNETLFGMVGIPIKEGRELMAHYHRLPKTAARIKALEAEVAVLRNALKGHTESGA